MPVKMNKIRNTEENFTELVEIIAHLRSDDGCPWDKEQTHESIAKNMIEEAYEAVEAIEEHDAPSLKEELGDVLLQVLLHSQIASDEGEFNIDDVIEGITNKMIGRHPHVFGSEASFAAFGFNDEEIAMIECVDDAYSALALWDRIKLVEKSRKQKSAIKTTGEAPAFTSILNNVPKNEPALMQAQNISRKAAALGFEWQDIEGVMDKLAEEFEEFSETEVGTSEAEEEFGDILFTLVNVARFSGIDSESALRRSCEKFRTRFSAMEAKAQEGGFELQDQSAQKWNELWESIK